MAGLGLGIGLNKKGRGALTSAMAGGQDAFNAYMSAHPNITGRLAKLEGQRAGSKQGQNWANMVSASGLKPVAPPASNNPALTDPNAGAAGSTLPSGTPTSTMDPNWYSKFVSDYEMPVPKELQQVSDTATANLDRLNAMPLPSYQEQFGTYKDLMERELDKQTADLTEAYGARGGRYTSDLTTASADMRRKGLQDLSAQGIQAMTSLNQQRMGELSGTMNLLQGVGVSKANMDQQAAQTAWQNYLMGTSPPEMMDKMLSWSASFSPPGSVVTQK